MTNILRLGSLTLLAGTTYIGIDEKRRNHAKLSLDATYRIGNLVTTVASIASNYAYALSFESYYQEKHKSFQTLLVELEDLQKEQEVKTFELWNTKNAAEKTIIQDKMEVNRKRIDIIAEKIAQATLKGDGRSWLSGIHLKSAKKLTKMCSQNKGLYIKIGQHLSMLDHIIPEEYQSQLSVLLSNNPHSSIESVRRIIQEDLGKYPEEIFDSFEAVPIASASLAQVHVAYKNKVKYAVKIQHEGLLEGSTADRYAITVIVDVLSKLFIDFDYNWLTREMNANLPMELDFNNERRNIAKCKQCLKKLVDRGDVAIPSVLDEASSHRVLTMKFEEGCYISDKASIKKMGLQPADIARLTSTTFYEQM
jgi:predicted unusual protein kinase regulating ubiquinone biosynthesis (AarF/ABC1/UbiB family)